MHPTGIGETTHGHRGSLASIGSPRPSATDGSGIRHRSGSWATSSTSRSRSGSSARRSGSRSAGRSWPACSASSPAPSSWPSTRRRARRSGLPQMIQSRAQFGYRGVIVPLFATRVHLPRVQRRRPGAAGRGPQRRVRLERATRRDRVRVGAALLAIYGHDWVHRIFRILLYISLPLMLVLTVGVIFGAAGGGNRDNGDVRVGRVHGAVLRGGGVQHHLRAVRLRLLALPARARRRTARSSRPCSSARPAPRSG